MSYWRPTETGCIYVIPDIHGMYNQLRLVLNRILPLRNNDSAKDTIVFLGDYIDRGADSHKVVDLVMKVKEDHPGQVITLLGNHELLLRKVISPSVGSNYSSNYRMWFNNGGDQTLQGYMQRQGNDGSPYLVHPNQVHRYIPDEHYHFFCRLDTSYQTDEYIFVHGGCDPNIDPDEQDPVIMVWDRSLIRNVMSMASRGIKCPWERTLITGHNTAMNNGYPFIYDKFMMLDGSAVERLYVMELHSRQLFSARKGKKRLVREPIP